MDVLDTQADTMTLAQGETAAPRSRWKRVARTAASVGLSVGLLAYMFVYHVPWDEFLNALSKVSAAWMVVVAAVMLLNRFTMTVKWWFLLRAQGVRLGLWRLTLIQFLSYFVGQMLPGAVGLDVVRTWMVAKSSTQRGVVVASVLVDRITSLVALAVVCLLGLMLTGAAMPGRPAIMLAALAVLAGFLVMAAVSGPLDRWLTPRLDNPDPSVPGRRRWGARVLQLSGRLIGAINRYHRRPLVLLQTVGWGVLVQLTRCLEVYLIFWSLGRPDVWEACLVAMPVVMFATMVPLGLSSVAVGAGVMVMMFKPLGVSPAVAMLASVLGDGLALGLIPLGAIAFVWWNIRARREGGAALDVRIMGSQHGNVAAAAHTDHPVSQIPPA
jgi:uncharacterized protein (TIRG00374 family)